MKNKAALITGCAKRIGREMAISLAAQGFDIAINYHNSKEEAAILAQEIQDKFKVKSEIFYCDLKNQNEVEALILKVAEVFPNLNLLINNASIFNKSKFLTAAKNEFFDNLNIHFTSPLILSKEFANHVLGGKIKGSQIINIVDKNITRYDTSYFYYLLSKKFLAEFTKMLALELAPNIRVNAIAPGYILDNVHNPNPSKEYVEKITKQIPLQKKGDVKNICETLNFLLANDFVNGQIIFVDGAASLNFAG